MNVKVFPHGTGDGNKPTRYLVRQDYPGRKTRALWGSNLSAKMENSTGYKIRLVRMMS